MDHTKHALLASGLLLSLITLPARAARATDELIANTVRITSYDGFLAPYADGSGVIITPQGSDIPVSREYPGSFILTNAHVVSGSSGMATTRIAIETNRGKKGRAGICWFNIDLDIAVLRTNIDLGPGLPVRPAAPEVGSTVWTVGMPQGMGWTLSNGIVSAVREEIVDPYFRTHGHAAPFDSDPISRHLLQITAPISPGSSGGPVCSEKGALIALATSTLASGQNLNFAVLLDARLATLVQIAEQQTPPVLTQPLNIPEDFMSFYIGATRGRSERTKALNDISKTRLQMWEQANHEVLFVPEEYEDGPLKGKINQNAIAEAETDIDAALLPIWDTLFPNSTICLSAACISKITSPQHAQFRKQFIERFPKDPETITFLLDEARQSQATPAKIQAIIRAFRDLCAPSIPPSERTPAEKHTYDLNHSNLEFFIQTAQRSASE